MSQDGALVIEPLNRGHDRAAFRCGVESLDRYLRRQASQDVRRRVSRVFIARSPDDVTRVLGYYTLSALSIDLSALPDHLAKKLPRHPVPAALVGRLAVEETTRGRGVGRMLLTNAIWRTLAVSDEIAIYAMVVDAIDEKAAGFFEQFGFSRLARGCNRLFLPLRSF